jgi:hypothetical protein
MKRSVLAVSMATALTFSGSALAGPPPGHPFYRGSSFMQRHRPRPHATLVQQSKTGVPVAANFRWKSKPRWVGGHKFRRIVRGREPLH